MIQCGTSPSWFDGFGLSVSDDVSEEYCDIVYTSGNEIASMIDGGMCSGGVEICDPSSEPINIFSRPMFGTIGAARLMEYTLNILARITDRL